MSRILLVTTSGCPHSIRLKQIFLNKKIDFYEVNIFQTPLFIDTLAELTDGNKTVPRVFFNSVHIGGLRQVLDLIQSGKFDSMVQSALSGPPLTIDLPPPPVPKTTTKKDHIKLNPVLESLFQELHDGHSFGKKGKNPFKSSDFIHFMTKQKGKEKSDAVKLGLKFQEMGYMYRTKDPEKPFADDSATWKFTIDKDDFALNSKLTNPPRITSPTGEATERDCIKLGRSLYEDMVSILENNINENGYMDYDQVLSSETWNLFCNDLLELNIMIPINESHVPAVIVFFSQLYFILSNHITILTKGQYEPRRMCSYSYLVNGKQYTLSSISYVLRTTKLPKLEKFKSSDDKKVNKDKDKDKDKKLRKSEIFPVMTDNVKAVSALGLSNMDYRTLFVNYNHNLASPPVLTLNLDNFDYALQWNAEALCSECRVLASKKALVLPFILFSLFRDLLHHKEVFVESVSCWLRPREEHKLSEVLKTTSISDLQLLFRKPREDATFLTIMNFMEPTNELPKTMTANPVLPEEEFEFPSEAEKDDSLPPQSEEKRIEVFLRVTTVQQTRLHKINLTSMDLTEIPPILVDKPYPLLKRMECGKNNIVALPPSFSTSLSGITYLFLNYNHLKSIPRPIAELSQLECLDLSHNQISSIPPLFFNLRDLKQINLNHNKLKSLPIAFPQLRALEDVGLAYNGLTCLPYNFGELRKMETLDLSNNLLTSMPDLSNLNALTELYLQKNKISELEFGLIGIRHLFTFNVSYNNISTLPQNISRLVYLKEFNISNNQLTKLPPHICELLSVQKLNLDSNPISEPSDKIYRAGIKEIRDYFKWEKPLGVPPYIFGDYVMSTTPKKQTVERSLSVKEKQALFLKKKRTHYIFDESHEYRKNGFDLSLIVAQETIKNDEKENAEQEKEKQMEKEASAATITKQFRIDLTSLKQEKTEHTVEIVTGATLLVVHGLVNYDVEKPGTVTSEIKIQNFSFKPLYLERMAIKPYLHFLGISKEDGPMIISIEVCDEEEHTPTTTRLSRAGSTRGRSKSLAVMNQRLKTKSSKTRIGESFLGTKDKEKDKDKEVPSSRKNRSISGVDRSITPERERETDQEDGTSTNRLNLDTATLVHHGTVLVRTSKDDKIIEVPIQTLCKGPKQVLKTLKEDLPEYSGIQFKFCRNSSINEDLITLEQRLTPKGYKFGILHATKTNKTENCFFGNKDSSPELDEFLEWIGEKVELADWKKYDAGLDVSGTNMTGTHSIFTESGNIPIMFHVSTMIPFEQDDDQQLQRKRHLGNDVVIILFEESDVDWQFDPSIIRSYFNHVFLVIRKDVAESKYKGSTVYRIAVTSKKGVSEFGPGIPVTSVLEKNAHSRSWLLTKLINAERAAYSAPGFSKAIERTRGTLIQALFDEHYTSGGWGTGW